MACRAEIPSKIGLGKTNDPAAIYQIPSHAQGERERGVFKAAARMKAQHSQRANELKPSLLRIAGIPTAAS
jgi:hypothetical protein